MLKIRVSLITVIPGLFSALPAMADVFNMGPGLTSLETVAVGNPGNPHDVYDGGFGGVNYAYSMGKFEVTAGQYCEFLNAVAATDTYGLYDSRMPQTDPQLPYHVGCKIFRSGESGSYTYTVAADWANRPVNYVSWGDAARFANWLHNGQPSGSQDNSTTEDGAYALHGATSHAALMTVTRRPNARWAIPSEDEWYKAAYHKNDGATAHYFGYPTRSDTVPSNRLVNPDPGNNATFYTPGLYTVLSPYFRSEAGAHENSASPYGTFDQGGNVMEWTEGIMFRDYRVVRGGDYDSESWSLHATCRGDDGSWRPETAYMALGFRVAQVPEPATLAMLGVAAGLLLRRRR